MDGELHANDGGLFVDGSDQHGSLGKEWLRAGWAVVAVDTRGRLAATVPRPASTWIRLLLSCLPFFRRCSTRCRRRRSMPTTRG